MSRSNPVEAIIVRVLSFNSSNAKFVVPVSGNIKGSTIFALDRLLDLGGLEGLDDLEGLEGFEDLEGFKGVDSAIPDIL
jgi:hypothetical protein